MEQNTQQLLERLASLRNTRPLLDDKAVLDLLSALPGTAANLPATSVTARNRRVIPITGGIAALCLAGAYFMWINPPATVPAAPPAPAHITRTDAPAIAPAQAAPSVPAQTDAAPATTNVPAAHNSPLPAGATRFNVHAAGSTRVHNSAVQTSFHDRQRRQTPEQTAGTADNARTMPVSADAASSALQQAPASIPGIDALQLTPAELRDLGVTATADTVIFTTESKVDMTTADNSVEQQSMRQNLTALGYPASQPAVVTRLAVSIGHYADAERILPYSRAAGTNPGSADDQPLPAAFSVERRHTDPRPHNGSGSKALTPATGHVTMYTMNTGLDSTGAPVSPQDLVPVKFWLVKQGAAGTADAGRSTEITLWYAPSQAFTNALPPRYRNQLSNELHIQRQVQRGLPVMRACEAIAGDCSLLDVCRSASMAAWDVRITPNPACGKTACRFRLKYRAHASAHIYTANGTFVRTAQPDVLLEQGEQVIALKDAEALPKGAYLLLLIVDGQQVVKRFIVNG